MPLKKHALHAAVVLGALAAPPLAPDAAAQPLPQVSVGRIERLEKLPSRHVDARHVDIWLPPQCTPAQRCGVLYMHDGQMLFDAGTTWNRQAWNVHLAIDGLVRAQRIEPTIVVGIWNNGALRHSEYFPQKFLPHVAEPVRSAFMEQALGGRPRSDAYLRFIVEELKPLIDQRFPTRAQATHTAIMGSSMGGLISIYAMNEYPQVFGAAAGLSTHWVGARQANAALPLGAFVYLRDQLAPPDGRRLYMDHGTTELDALYAPYQRFIDEIVRERGYTARDSVSRVFEGTGHNETAWAQRVQIPLEFLLAPR